MLIGLFALTASLSVNPPPPDPPDAPQPSAGADGATPIISSGMTRPRLVAGTITDADYPADALAGGAGGTTFILLTVGPAGEVVDCTVAVGTGHAAIDLASCTLAQARFRYEPGRDAAGQAVTSSITQPIRWVHPSPIAQAAPPPMRFESSMFAYFLLASPAGMKCWKESVNVHGFADPRICPEPERAAEAEILSATSLASVVFRFTPAGQAPAALQTPRGDLFRRLEAEVVFRRDGRVMECRLVGEQLASSGGSICDDARRSLRIERARDRGVRRARVSIEGYSFEPAQR